jgi:spore coat protein U-like protein
MTRKVFPALVVAAMLGSMSMPALAVSPHSTSSSESLTATVVPSCHVTTNGFLNFGQYVPNGVPNNSTQADFTNSFLAGSSAAVMQCTANTPFDVSVPQTHSLMHGTSHPASTLPYTYNVLGTFSPVGSSPNQHCPLNTNTNHAGGTTDSAANPVQIEFAGCVEHGLWPAPDAYTDTFTFTVMF